jgi:RNA polymerase sigma-70 factor (ECF subfamily)
MGVKMLERETIAAVYERHGHAVLRRCVTLLSDEDDAHDALHEVFVRFVAQHSRFRWRSSVFTYLYRIATHVCVDRLRAQQVRSRSQSVEALLRAVENPPFPDQRATVLGELATITRGLDEETLTVAVMAHVDGLTQDEIAAALRLSRRTVGKRLSRFLAHTRARAARVRADEEARLGQHGHDGKVRA